MASLGLLLTLFFLPLATADSIWTVHILNGPAPPPDKRPPISRHATYDPSQLVWQIPSIIGSYLVVVLLIGICILTFGRRMRLEAQSGASSKSHEMVRTPSRKGNLDPSPVSPSGSSTMWKRWHSPRLNRSRSDASRKSPEAPSVVSFDSVAMEEDRVKREEETARIYGQIMSQGQDVKAPKMLTISENELAKDVPYRSPGPYHFQRTASTSSHSFSQPRPPQREMVQMSQLSFSTQPAYTQSNSSMQPLYPAHDEQRGIALSPGLQGYYPADMLASSPGSVPPQSSRPLAGYATVTPPPHSHSSQPSRASNHSRRSGTRNSSVRSLVISDPIPIPTIEDQIAAEARMPRTSRYYADPGRPPTPPTARTERPMTPPTTRSERPMTPPTTRSERPMTMIEDDFDSDLERMQDAYKNARESNDGHHDNESDVEIETDDELDHERHHNATPESIIGSYGEPRTPKIPRPPTARTTLRNEDYWLGTQHMHPPVSSTSTAFSPATTAFSPQANQTFPKPPSRTTTPSLRTQTKTSPPPPLSLTTPSRTTTPGTVASIRTQTRTPPQHLQFRAIHPPTTLEPAGAHFSPPLETPHTAFAISPALPVASNTNTSPGGTKTTFLSPRRDRFGLRQAGASAGLPGGLAPIVPNTALLTARTLFTAGLATPYSPYMPTSPMTPITPHLTSKRERREIERERGRLAATQDDAVEDEDDMWGTAYAD